MYSPIYMSEGLRGKPSNLYVKIISLYPENTSSQYEHLMSFLKHILGYGVQLHVVLAMMREGVEAACV